MLVKILHMISGSLVILNFVVLCFMLLTPQTRTPGRMAVLTRAQHICYLLVVLFGVWQLVKLLPDNVPDWVWAKIILFVVAVSASAKAVRAREGSTQMKVGLIIAAIAYIGIIWLVATKPNLGQHKTSIENKPVSSSSTSSSGPAASSTGASSSSQDTTSDSSTSGATTSDNTGTAVQGAN